MKIHEAKINKLHAASALTSASSFSLCQEFVTSSITRSWFFLDTRKSIRDQKAKRAKLPTHQHRSLRGSLTFCPPTNFPGSVFLYKHFNPMRKAIQPPLSKHCKWILEGWLLHGPSREPFGLLSTWLAHSWSCNKTSMRVRNGKKMQTTNFCYCFQKNMDMMGKADSKLTLVSKAWDETRAEQLWKDKE